MLRFPRDEVFNHTVESIGISVVTKDFIQHRIDDGVAEIKEVADKGVVVTGSSFMPLNSELFKSLFPSLHIKPKTLVKKFPDAVDMILFKCAHGSNKETDF